MIEKFLNKEEKKIFSIKNINRIKKNDFKEYLKMEETILESLKKNYQPHDFYYNYTIEARIKNQEEYVQALKNYYQNVINKKLKDEDKEILNLEKDLNKMIKEFDKIQK